MKYEFSELDEWEIVKKEKTEEQFMFIHKIRLLVFNFYYSWFIMGVIIYALFASNVKFLFWDNRADVVFDILNIIVMVIFIFDFIANCLIRIDYPFSFYFFMDIASFLLLFFDYSTIREKIFDNDSTVNKIRAYNFFLIFEILRIIRIM